jgi:hypothetical protein
VVVVSSVSSMDTAPSLLSPSLEGVKARSPRRQKKIATRPLVGMAGHFKKDGTPKNQYRTQAEAKSAAQLAWTLNGVDLSTYRCNHCHQWHMGKDSRED